MAITINGNGTITGVSVGGLPDGIVDTDMIAANAVATAKIADSAVTSAKSSGLGGLTMADQWRLSSSKDDCYGTAQVTANWERNDNNFSVVGTGMTQSNGTFTFPATGIYLIRAVVWFRGKGDERQHLGLLIKATTNNSSYSEIAEVFDSSGNRHGHNSDACVVAEAMFDVTNVSTHKVQLWHNTVGNADMNAQNNAQCTGLTFLKLGDT